MFKTISLYCTRTETYAVVEQEIEDGLILSSNMLSGEKIEMQGNGWVFAGTSTTVCEGFSNRGWVLRGCGAPEATATRAYVTQHGFDAACRRLTGVTVAEHLQFEDEVRNAGYDYMTKLAAAEAV